MPVLDTTELKWESKLWFHTTIIGMFRFNMSATQGWTLAVLCQNPTTAKLKNPKLKSFTMQVWLRCSISVLLPCSGWLWMAAFIPGAQLPGYLEFPASSVLQGGKGLLGTLRWGGFYVSSINQSSFVCAPVWICCPRKAGILPVTFIPVVSLPQAQVCILKLGQKVWLWFSAVTQTIGNSIYEKLLSNVWKVSESSP